jgi:alpha-glucosidase
VVVICDPGIKIENGYKAYEDGAKDDVFIKYPDGPTMLGKFGQGGATFQTSPIQKPANGGRTNSGIYQRGGYWPLERHE